MYCVATHFPIYGRIDGVIAIRASIWSSAVISNKTRISGRAQQSRLNQFHNVDFWNYSSPIKIDQNSSAIPFAILAILSTFALMQMNMYACMSVLDGCNKMLWHCTKEWIHQLCMFVSRWSRVSAYCQTRAILQHHYDSLVNSLY